MSSLSPDRPPETGTDAPTTPTAAAQQAAGGVVELYRGLRSHMRTLPTGGLTPSQASVLLRLYKDGASTTTALAAAEGVRSQSMTATLNSLDELGLIERRPDPEDGRRHVITLSRAGEVRAEADRQSRYAWLERAMDEHFTAAQLRTINEALALLAGLARQ